MTITYQETVYQVRCQCGQTFFVSMGHCQRKTIKLPHLVSTICPGCLEACWISYRPLKSKRQPVYHGKGRPESHPAPNRILFEDQKYLEAAVKLYQRKYQVSENNLHSLIGAVQAAIRAWEHNWQRAVMPTQFKELVRVLREQTPQP